MAAGCDAMLWSGITGTASMHTDPTSDPILTRFRAAVDTAFGDRIARIVLFGSRARGDARPDSDYDIGLFLHDASSFDRDARLLAEIETDLLTATGAVVNTVPLPASAYAERTAWMQEVRRDGLPL